MKQVYSLLGWFLPTALFLFWSSGESAALRAQCTLVCQGQVNIGLGASCSAVIEYTDLLTNPNACAPGGAANYAVTVMNAGSTGVLPGSPLVTGAQIGQLLPVKVTHLPTGNSCWGSILIQDELGPQLICPPDVTVACTANTSIAAIGQPQVSDCSGSSFVSFDNIVDNACGDPLRTIERTFIATDGLGNTSSCTQTISVANPATLPVIFPPNLDGFDNPALACGTNVSTDPAATGRPTIGGQPIENGAGCPLVVNFVDQVVPVCEGTTKIFRNWTVVQWCSGTVLTDVQVIKVADTTPPVLTCPQPIVAGTSSGQSCTGDVALPPIQVSDDCSSTVSVSIFTPVGIVNSNGGTVSGLALGEHTITYLAQDACGNVSTCEVQLTVVDDHVPTVICDEITTVTVNASGVAELPALNFDDGSYDNCCPLTYEVRRMSPGCDSGTAFGPTVRVCCADIGQSLQVEMRATDCFGNFNSCMVTVNVDDKTDPVISCPADVTLRCTDDLTDTNLTGVATANDGCGAVTPTVVEIADLNMCGLGTVIRTYTATDAFGNSTNCTQTITLIDDKPFSVDWPEDFTLSACVGLDAAEPDSLPAGFDRPVFINDDCELLAVSREDQVLTVAAPACRKIVRTWTVLNWCTFEANGSGAGLLTYQQTIKIIDNDAPTFTCPADLNLSTDAGSCGTTVTLPQPTDIVDCSEDVQVAISSDFGIGFGPFSDVPPGDYSATYTVFDGCGNSDACTIAITVRDSIAPVVYCQDGIIIDLSEDLTAAIWASDFSLNSSDACPGALRFAFSSNPLDTGRVLGCADLGTQPIEIFVFDAVGNENSCTSSLTIQDNINPCTPPVPQTAQLGGMIQNDQGMAVQNVSVAVSGSGGGTVMTDASGEYAFPQLPLGDDYTISPDKLTDPLNGVSTYDIVILRKHVLGIEPLTNPYRIIAADANNSGSVTALDMAEIRKAILYINDGFPANKSWRFVDGSYTFLDPTNPLDEPWPEVRNVNNFAGDLSFLNFVAVKIGDLTGNAVPNLQGGNNAEDRGAPVVLAFEDQTFEADGTIRVPLRATDVLDLAALQLGLRYDPAVLRLERIENAALSLSAGQTHRPAPGVVMLAHDLEAPQVLQVNQPLLTLVFITQTAGDLAGQLQLTDRYTPPLAFGPTSPSGRPIALRFGAAVTDFAATLAPNPFSGHTQLSFSLPSPATVQLELYDWSGRRVLTRQAPLTAGRHRWMIAATALPGSGSYVYRLRAGTHTISGNMVLVE